MGYMEFLPNVGLLFTTEYADGDEWEDVDWSQLDEVFAPMRHYDVATDHRAWYWKDDICLAYSKDMNVWTGVVVSISIVHHSQLDILARNHVYFSRRIDRQMWKRTKSPEQFTL